MQCRIRRWTLAAVKPPAVDPGVEQRLVHSPPPVRRFGIGEVHQLLSLAVHRAATRARYFDEVSALLRFAEQWRARPEHRIFVPDDVQATLVQLTEQASRVRPQLRLELER